MKEVFGRIDKQLESVASGHGDIHVIAQLSEEAMMFRDLAMKKHVQISDLGITLNSFSAMYCSLVGKMDARIDAMERATEGIEKRKAKQDSHPGETHPSAGQDAARIDATNRLNRLGNLAAY